MTSDSKNESMLPKIGAFALLNWAADLDLGVLAWPKHARNKTLQGGSGSTNRSRKYSIVRQRLDHHPLAKKPLFGKHDTH